VNIEQHIAQLGLTLPAPPVPRGDYEPVVVHGTMAYVSGQLSRVDGGVIAGPVRDDTPPQVIADAGQVCVLRALSALRQALGDLDRVERIVFLRGFVNATPDFHDHPAVLDSASRLLLRIFGDAGRHARSAVGVAGLPSGGLLEIELTAAPR